MDYKIDRCDQFTITGPNEIMIGRLQVEFRHGVISFNGLYVHHEHRRKGIARSLINEALAIYGNQPIYLTAWAYSDMPMSDQQLMQFYESFGFRPIPEAPGRMVRKVL